MKAISTTKKYKSPVNLIIQKIEIKNARINRQIVWHLLAIKSNWGKSFNLVIKYKKFVYFI